VDTLDRGDGGASIAQEKKTYPASWPWRWTSGVAGSWRWFCVATHLGTELVLEALGMAVNSWLCR
jgi:hypothetical protein